MPSEKAAPDFCKLPERRSLCGRVTWRHIARFLCLYAVVLCIGIGINLLSSNPHFQAFGLGLMLPGGGFFAHADFSSWQGVAHIGIALLGLLAFCIGLAIWLATGNVLAAPLIWLFFALAAASMKHGHAYASALPSVLGIIVFAALTGFLVACFRKAIGLRKRREANSYLSERGHIATFLKNTEKHSELSVQDLKLMRFMLDRALQPVAEFNGFEWLDQFQTAAVRYQINFIGYALSMAQATYLPALHGYLEEAQKNLILKQTDYRVWKYWTLENLWGNLEYNPDPIARENIMYTGFCATQMLMYHRASGQNDFNTPDSFLLRHPSGKNYAYAFPDLVRALYREANRSAFCLVACEPNWIYPLCNTIGAAAMKAQDTDLWQKHEPLFRENLENEFIDLQGKFFPCRSRYTGFALPSSGGVMPQALPCFFLNATLPDIALRQWLLLRRRIMNENSLRRSEFWPIDTGNYRFSRAVAYTTTALAAAEMGDEEVKNLCLLALEEECPANDDDGHFYRPKASVWAHAVEFLARSTHKNSFATLVNKGESKTRTPHISQANYPDILVARAMAEDGILRTVLYIEKGASVQKIILSGLVPGRDYTCLGTQENTVRADDGGQACLHITPDGRKEIEIRQTL